MTECWSEGELRAYIDRELPAEAMERVAAHLEECSECGDLWAELAGRAGRVSALMNELAEPGPAVRAPRMPRRAGAAWKWVAALAAGVAIGILALPKHTPHVAVVPPAPPAVVESAGNLTDQPVQLGASHNAVTLAGTRPGKAAPSQRNRRRAAPGLQGSGPFLALDDDPIECGGVWVGGLGPREV